ncbi:MAG: hypothetical protein M0T80_02195 [Actinomycetota bacterium]|nr:hypothetical protein [Actinomycetota bacterium]
MLRASVAEVAVDDNDLRTEISLRDPGRTKVLGGQAVRMSRARSVDGFPAFGVLLHGGVAIGETGASLTLCVQVPYRDVDQEKLRELLEATRASTFVGR